MTYIYVMPIHENYNGYGFLENGGLPPPQPPENGREEVPEKKPSVCTRLLSCCKCCKKQKQSPKTSPKKEKDAKKGCFSCCKKSKKENDMEEKISIPVQETVEEKSSCLDRLKCCNNRIGETGCCKIGKRKEIWAERRDSILSDVPKRSKCKNFFRKLFCLDCCKSCKKTKSLEDPISRRESMLSKKKSLTPTVLPEEPKPKLDFSLVEHASVMKAAIPVLPVYLAWFCLVCNVILPGIGTIFSGMFCLCIGKPRFSQKDGARPRIGAFIIDLIIGVGQLFTVLFCLVGWGWSIWWGVIMLKLAKKHRKLRILEANSQEPVPVVNQNHTPRDPELGS